MPPECKVGVGAWLGSESRTALGIGEQASRIEGLGFHSFWLPESHFVPGYCVPAPLLFLMAAAAHTKTLKLGTGSYLLPIRNAVQMAEEVAVLDQLSQGRVILGVGRGYQKKLFSAYQISSRNKRQLFEESLEKMMSAWVGNPLRVEGQNAKNDTYLSPLPFQKPHPPIWVAAFGPKGLEQAGRLGLPYLASPLEPLTTLESKYAMHKELHEKFEHGTVNAIPVMRTVFVSEENEKIKNVREGLDAEARLRAESPILSIRSSAEASSSDWAIVGGPNEVADKIELYKERLGMSHLIATQTRLSHLTLRETEASLEYLAAIVN